MCMYMYMHVYMLILCHTYVHVCLRNNILFCISSCLLVMQLWDGIQSPLEGSVPAAGADASTVAVNGTISNPRPRIIVIGATNRPQVCVCVCVFVCACVCVCMYA